MRNIHKNPLFYLVIILVVVTGFMFSDLARALQSEWLGPENAFPELDVAAPVDVTGTSQTKIGSLVIDSAAEEEDKGVLISEKFQAPKLQIIDSAENNDSQDVRVKKDGICLKEVSWDIGNLKCRDTWSEIDGVESWSDLERVIMFSVECTSNCGNSDVEFKENSTQVWFSVNPDELDSRVDVKGASRLNAPDAKGNYYSIMASFEKDRIDSSNIISAQLIRKDDSDFNKQISIGDYSSSDKIEFGISDDASLNNLKVGDKIKFIVALPPGVSTPPPPAPNPPSSFLASYDSNNERVNLSWKDVSGETSYTIQRRTTSQVNADEEELGFINNIWSEVKNFVVGDAWAKEDIDTMPNGNTSWYHVARPYKDSTSAYDANVVGGATYQYRIKACNGPSCSAWQESGLVTIPGTTDTSDTDGDTTDETTTDETTDDEIRKPGWFKPGDMQP